MKTHHRESSIFGDPVQGRAEEPAQDGAGGPASGRDEPRVVRHVRVRGTRRLIVLLVALGLVVGTGAVAVSVLWPVVTSFSESNDYAGGGSGAVSVVVHSGDASRTIGAALQKAGVVKTAKAFGDAASGNSRSGSIQPGTYALHHDMSAASAVAMLLDPANRTVPTVTIREGLWTAETIRILAAATGRPAVDYEVALKNPAALGLPVAARGSAEGYLFPSTYEFAADATAAEQLHTMVAKSLETLNSLAVPADKMARVMTIASIVEAEASDKPDRPKVARVIENRLAKKMPLQLDTTVSFITRMRGKAGTTNAERASRSPYNTYLVAGLPPGPINSPGLSSIQAAIHPNPGQWIYFVAVNPDTGETRFAVTATGHAANVKLFLKWCSTHPGKC